MGNYQMDHPYPAGMKDWGGNTGKGKGGGSGRSWGIVKREPEDLETRRFRKEYMKRKSTVDTAVPNFRKIFKKQEQRGTQREEARKTTLDVLPKRIKMKKMEFKASKMRTATPQEKKRYMSRFKTT